MRRGPGCGVGGPAVELGAPSGNPAIGKGRRRGFEASAAEAAAL